MVAEVAAEAHVNARRRQNRNFHPSAESRCQRLLNAIEPDSYIRPHRHLDVEKDEAFVLLSGRLAIITFDDDGTVAETAVLSAESGNLAVELPHGSYHTALSLESGTVFYEAKAGPYRQLTAEEIAPWAPEAGSPPALAYFDRLRALFS
jgi:cupin fold WbuC family metalloprotein